MSKRARFQMSMVVEAHFDADGTFLNFVGPTNGGLFSDAEEGIWDDVAQDWVDADDTPVGGSGCDAAWGELSAGVDQMNGESS